MVWFIAAVLLIGAVLGVLSWLALRPSPNPDRAARTARAQELLRACSGMPRAAFDAASEDERRQAIETYVSDPNAPLTITADFRRGQILVGMSDDAPLPCGIRRFQISRAIVSMLDNAKFLAAAAVLFDEGLLAEKSFDVFGFSLVFQDGQARLVQWESWQPVKGLRNPNEALAWIMEHRFMTSQAAKENLRVTLYQLEQSHPDSEAVAAARRLIG